MKIRLTIAFGCLFLTTASVRAQTTASDSIELDLLKAPSSPAFNLLGISPTQIDRPTDLNAFKVSIQNATNNFSKLPNSYAVEIAPASLMKMKNQTFADLNSTKFKDVFWQSLSFSFGATHADKDGKETDDGSAFTRLGFGLKFSIIRPQWTEKTSSAYEALKQAQQKALNSIDSLHSASNEIAQIKIKIKNSSGAERIEYLDRLASLNADFVTKQQASLDDNSTYKSIKEAAGNLLIERKKGFLDFAGGLALDFPTDQFNYSMISKAGAWLTGGYEGGNNGLSILGIGRYLFQPDKIFADDSGSLSSANISTFDIGGKVLLSALSGKFTASVETIYRSVLTKDVIDPNWRLVFSAEYNVGKNQKLTLALGKNFDGTITKDGNLISALNYIIGFGSTKQIHD